MSKDVQAWADKAMFEAAPMTATDGPQVHLLSITQDPLGAMAAANKMYVGEVVTDLAQVTDEERMSVLADLQRTKLKAPMEFVHVHFLIEGVTRSFTHQIVRQRTAVYAQESLRFAVKADMPIAIPPSLQGLEASDLKRQAWDDGIAAMKASYTELVANGVPAEDARGMLPHSVLTRLHYATNMRNLQDHAGNRLCTQAQFEWRAVFTKIAEAIAEAYVRDSRYVDLMATYGEEFGNRTAVMNRCQQIKAEYAGLASIFRPVCYLTGKCEFKASADRACSIRDRVDAFAASGIPSSVWGEGVDNEHDGTIPPIHPAEWLLDHQSARVR